MIINAYKRLFSKTTPRKKTNTRFPLPELSCYQGDEIPGQNQHLKNLSSRCNYALIYH